MRKPPHKQVGRATYFHRSSFDCEHAELSGRIAEAEVQAGQSGWNVAKFRSHAPDVISLLTYEDFSVAFPALLESATINLATGALAARCYRARANPPVLHRKELLLPDGHPDFERFAALTRALEALGLFENTASIGTRRGWENRLSACGVSVEDHELIVSEVASGQPVHRHRAAIVRTGFSTPIQALLNHQLVDHDTRVFDYGCGRGTDVLGLDRLGIRATGWDPYFAPETPKTKAEVVNLGFVLNVIERPLERVDALKEAFALAGQCLAVAVIQPNLTRWIRGRPFNDGVMTRLGTFQKFYTSAELRDLIQVTLGKEAFQVAPGVMFVFKDMETEQAFLLRKQSQRRHSPLASTHRRAALRARHSAELADQLEAVSTLALTLGRWPAEEDAPSDLASAVTEKGVSWSLFLKLAADHLEPAALADAAHRRRTDLRVYFALNIFNQRTRYRALPEGLQRDVRTLFGGYEPALKEAKALLFSLADSELLIQAATQAHEVGIGHLTDDCFWIGTTEIPGLPAVLRCMVGCAARYYGELDDLHVLKLHLKTGKVSALEFSGFGHSPFPTLRSRVKIDLRRQRISEFDHSGQNQKLVGKSRLMRPDALGFERQRAIDALLERAGLDLDLFRSTEAEIADAMKAVPPSLS